MKLQVFYDIFLALHLIHRYGTFLCCALRFYDLQHPALVYSWFTVPRAFFPISRTTEGNRGNANRCRDNHRRSACSRLRVTRSINSNDLLNSVRHFVASLFRFIALYLSTILYFILIDICLATYQINQLLTQCSQIVMCKMWDSNLHTNYLTKCSHEIIKRFNLDLNALTQHCRGRVALFTYLFILLLIT